MSIAEASWQHNSNSGAILLKGRKHAGVVLESSGKGFDANAATFPSILIDESDKKTLYLYYIGARKVDFDHAAIEIATSVDELIFRKRSAINPIIEFAKEVVTPSVFKAGDHHYIVFGFESVHSESKVVKRDSP